MGSFSAELRGVEPISMRKILFVSHDASRTGAPMVLLHLMRWLRDNTQVEFDVLFCAGGDIEPEFAALAPVYRIPSGATARRGRISRSWPGYTRIASAKQHLERRLLRRRLLQQRYGLIYANTAASWPAIDFLSPLSSALLLHVHEAESEITGRVGQENFNRLKSRADMIVACSHAVERYLVQHQDLASSRVQVVHSFVPATCVSPPHLGQDSDRRQKALNLPAQAQIVGACGTVSIRKGADLFVPLAIRVIQHMPHAPVHFLWIGESDLNARDRCLIFSDVRKSGLGGRVHFIGPCANARTYMEAFDLLLMLSREDPFPLVNLEAASLGKPIVCFENAGGTPELVRSDAGFVVPYLDLEAMSQRVVDLLKSKELRQQTGDIARARMHDSYQLSVGAPMIWRFIQQFVKD